MSVRVRYAPSPTGRQHIGGIRTALFNYFFARSQNGKFILRIEDTDRERYSPEALEDIYATFNWLGIHWDEGPDVGGPYGPYIQSERFELYKKYAKMLVERNQAYCCFCSPARLEKLRQEQLAHKESLIGYDRFCRFLKPEQVNELLQKGEKYVIRFKIPLEGTTVFKDELLGEIEKKNIDINPDPVLLKSDGFPTYHLANIVDDHLMKITHVMRSQEWISSGPLHILLYKAFAWQPPKFCHLPMVLGEDGQKLSKRHGATSVIEFKEKGYLPEALINYVSLLGWSYDESREFFTTAELEKLFSLEKLNKASAVFNYKKLEWFNANYIRKLAVEDLAQRLRTWLIKDGLLLEPLTNEQNELIKRITPLIQERLTLLAEATNWISFFFKEVRLNSAKELIPPKLDSEKTLAILEELKNLFLGFEAKSDEELEEAFRQLGTKLGCKLGDLLYPLRMALTGSKVSPPLIESMRILGFAKIKERIENAVAILKQKV